MIERLNQIKFPVYAQPTIPSTDFRFVLTMLLCNLLNGRNAGLQLGGLFKNRRILKNEMEIPKTERIEFLTVAAVVGIVDHTYAVLIKGDKLCVVNGFAVIELFRNKIVFRNK
jgi:hypothetical protein